MQDPRSASPLSSSLSTDRLTVVIVCSSLLAMLCLALAILFYACKCLEASSAGSRRGFLLLGGRGLDGIPGGVGSSSSMMGLSRETVKGLPVLNYEQLVKVKGGVENVECCAVCLLEFGKGDKKIRHLPRCGHSFHIDCIDMWLFSHTSCPICRDNLDQHDRQQQLLRREIPLTQSLLPPRSPSSTSPLHDHIQIMVEEPAEEQPRSESSRDLDDRSTTSSL